MVRAVSIRPLDILIVVRSIGDCGMEDLLGAYYKLTPKPNISPAFKGLLNNIGLHNGHCNLFIE